MNDQSSTRGKASGSAMPLSRDGKHACPAKLSAIAENAEGISSTLIPTWLTDVALDARKACGSEQQHVVILVRNEGQSQLDQGNMW